MKVLVVLAAVLAVASARGLFRRTQKEKPASVPFIVGGSDSAKGRWPWQLSLQRLDIWGDSSHTCGAVLLNANWVLCAAHCVMIDEDPSSYRVYAGAFNSGPNTDAEQVLYIDTIVMHPRFGVDVDGLPHDIAVFRLSTPANTGSSNVGGIRLASGSTDFAGNSNCWITGWGRTSGEAEGSSPRLQELNIPVFTNQECSSRWAQAPIIGDVLPILPEHICVGNDAGTIGACQGDSGGPLSCQENGQWVVAGITSRGWPDCEIYPSVYTRVSSYKSWVEGVISSY